MELRSPSKVFHAGVSIADLIREHARRASSRTAGRTEGLDLRGADLTATDLHDANLFRADLREARLDGANLDDVNLGLANLSNARIRGASMLRSVLDSADFSAADLNGSRMNRCEIFFTDFRQARMEDVNLTESIFRDSNLAGASLSGATLARVRIFRTECSGADFSDAHFFEADIDGSYFRGANFSNATFAHVRLTDTDLRHALGLERVRHISASSLSIDVLLLLACADAPPVRFLLAAGVPKVIVDYLPSLAGKAIDFDSTFISYSGKDGVFARTLYADLVENGVRCWLFEEDAKWGESVWHEIDRSIRVHDRVVVVCSRNSLRSEPVLREIERALQREDEEKRPILFPIRIDSYLFSKWEHHRKADVVAKVVGDFSGWREPPQYRNALRRLVEGLRKASTLARR